MTEKTHEDLALYSSGGDGHLRLPPREKVWRRARQAGLILLAVLAVGSARIVFVRASAKADLETQSAESQRVFVKTVSPTPTRSSGALNLPATLRGDNETTIYARVTGYVHSFLVDIGSRVTSGQALAELDTPDLDQQLAQAKAQLDTAKANTVLAKVALERWKKLFAQDSVARQDLDQHQNAFDTSVAQEAAALANVQQLLDMTAFKHVLAPFDGVITQRNVDLGNLINAGGSGVALFSMAKTDPLRVFVDAPQAYSRQIKVGEDVAVTQTEIPGRVFHGVVSRIAGAIDVTTRTQKVELRLPNPDGVLAPGAYVNVSLPLAPRGPLAIPANTLLFRAEGPVVAVVDDEGRAHLRKIVIANDLGATLEISQGAVGPQDKVIVNPPDSLADGDQVTTARLHPPHPGGKS